MMTGTQNVNNILYHTMTLFFLLLFAIYDYRHHKIRNHPLCAFLVWCIFSIPLKAVSNPDISWQHHLLQSLWGAVSGFIILLGTALMTHGSIGGGDIKLVSLLGVLYGLNTLIYILFISCICILLHYGLIKLAKKKTLSAIPFAPYLFIGCACCVLPQLYF